MEQLETHEEAGLILIVVSSSGPGARSRKYQVLYMCMLLTPDACLARS